MNYRYFFIILICFIVLVYIFKLIDRLFSKDKLLQNLLLGSVLGLLSILCIIISEATQLELFIGVSTIFIALSGLFNGGISAFITIIYSLFYIYFTKGIIESSSILIIFTAGIIGTIVNYTISKKHFNLKLIHIYIFGFFIHAVALLLTFSLTNSGGNLNTNLYGEYLIVLPILTPLIYLIFDPHYNNTFEVLFLKNFKTNYFELYNNSPDMYVSVNCSTFKITACNQTLINKTGYSKKELIGKSIFEMYHPECIEKATETFDLFKRIGKVINVNLVLKTKENKRIEVLLDVTAIKDKKGRILYSNSVWRDITELKKTESQLDFTNKLLALTFESSPIASAITKLPERKIIDINEAFVSLFGYTKKELVGKPVTAFKIWENNNEQQLVFELLKNNGEVNDFEFNFKTKNGELGTGLFYAEILNHQEETYVLIKIIDNTFRKNILEEINHSKKFVENIINASPDIIYIYDIEEQRNIFINEGIEINLGYTEEEIKLMGNQVISQLMHPEDFKQYLKTIVPKYFEVKDKELIIHNYRMRNKNGKWNTLLSKESVFFRNPNGSAKQIFGVAVDISEQKELEHELIVSEERLRLSTELANVAVWEYDFTTNNMTRSKNHDSLYGLKEQIEWRMETFINATHPDDREYSNQLIQNSVACKGPDKYSFDFRVIYPDKSIHWLMVTGQVIERNVKGEGIIVRGTLIDITDRKEIEEKLIAKDKQLTSIYNAVDDVIFLLEVLPNENYRFININQAFSKVTGIPPEMILQKLVAEVIPEPSLSKIVLKNYQKAIQTKSIVKWVEVTEYPKGALTGEVTISPIFDEKNKCTHLVGSVHDITEQVKAQAKIKESEANLYAMINNSNDSIWSLDLNYNYITFNKSYATHFFNEHGIELTNRVDARRFLSEEQYKFWIPLYEEVFKGNNKVFEFSHDFKDGKRFFQTSINPIYEEDKITGAVAMSIDISYVKNAENLLVESENRYRELFEHMNTGFILFEVVVNEKEKPVDLIIIAANDEFEKTTSIKIKDGIGKKLTTVLPGIENDKADWIGTYGKIALTGESKHFEDYSNILNKYYTVNAYRSRPNQCAVTFLDITDRKLAEIEIQNLNTELEKRVKERTIQLEAVNKELQAFTYSVSHDLKAPLRGIDGYSKLLIENYSEKLNNEAQQFIYNIRKGTSQMSQLIDDLLSYSRLERASIRFIKSDIKEIIKDILNIFNEEINKNYIQLNLNLISCNVIVDMDAISIALRNLIDNAIKFSNNKSKPEINISIEIVNNKCIISIKDNGIGFNMRFHDKIFEIFQRLHRVEDYPGTGIGLALVHKAMQRMNGKVYGASEQGKGSTFYLELPIT